MSALSQATFERARNFLRAALAKRGVHGMLSLRDAFEEYDADDSGALDFEEFAAAIMQYKLTTQEIRCLFMRFDSDGNGQIEYDEFVEGIRGELSAERKNIISNVFGELRICCDAEFE